MSDNEVVADDPSWAQNPAVEGMTNHIQDRTGTRSEYLNGTAGDGGTGVSGNAVTTLDQRTATKPGLAPLCRQDSSEIIDTNKPKSTFKITSVIVHEKGSSQDGRHSFGEEDEESAVEDSLLQTDAEDSPAPVSNFAEIVRQQQQQQHRQDRVDSTSRFKVVKIQKREPYKIGRWRISDFMSQSIQSSKIVQDIPVVHVVKHSDSGNSSRASSTHYVHGVDDPSKNPLASINAASGKQTLSSIQQSPHAPGTSISGLVNATMPSSGALELTNDHRQLTTATSNTTIATGPQLNNYSHTDQLTNQQRLDNAAAAVANITGDPSLTAAGSKVLPSTSDAHNAAVTNTAFQSANISNTVGAAQLAAGSVNRQLQTSSLDQSSATLQANTQVGDFS